MDGGKENTSPIFRSDDVLNSKSSSKNNNFFVKVTKNPLLRWLLRSKTVEDKPKPQSPPAPVRPVVVKKPKPQFRTTIRLSIKKLKTSNNTKTIIWILSSLIFVLCAVCGYLAYNYSPFTQKPQTSDFSISQLRSELLDLVKSSDTSSENISNVIQKLDEKINLVSDTEKRRSLKIYKLFLLVDTGYNVEALDYFDSIKDEPFSEGQLCELYEYRVLISATSSSSDDAEIADTYQQVCNIRKDKVDENIEEENSELEQRPQGEENEAK